MARRSRWTPTGWTQLALVRGNNGQSIFLDDVDRQYWLDLAAREAVRFGVEVHAFSLLHDKAYWLITPLLDNAVSQWMQSLGRYYVRYFNRRHQRSGTLWEGRYRAGLLQPERHLFAAMAFLDWAPVKGGLVAHPTDWKWSSYAHYAGLRLDKWLHPHTMLWSLGNTPFAREEAYVRLVAAGLSQDAQRAFDDLAMHGWPMGDTGFLKRLEVEVGVPVQRQKAGRRKKPSPHHDAGSMDRGI